MMNPWEKNWNTQNTSAPWERTWSDQDRKSAFSLKPLTEEQKTQAMELAKKIRPKRDVWGDISDVVKSTGEGLLSGTENYANGLTLGGYEWAGNKLGLGVSERKTKLQRQAEEAGLGGLNTVGNVFAELGGGLNGAGKLTYNLANKGVSGVGNALKFKRLANSSIAPLVLSGGVDSGINSTFRNDFSNPLRIWDDTKSGVASAGVLGTLGKGLVPISKVFSANSMTKGMKGGLNNVVSDTNALKIINSGIRQSDDVAQEFLNKAPSFAREINSETSDMLNHSLIRRVDVPKTVANQKAKYSDFLDKNADLEVLDFSNSVPSVRRHALDKGNSQQVLKSIRRNMQKNDPDFAMAKTPEGKIDYPHFLKDKQRAEYITTLPETYKTPQSTTKGVHNGKEREYLLKQYYNSQNGSDVYDIAIRSSDGTLINKITREGRAGEREFEKLRQARTSTSGTTSRTGQMENASVPAEQHSGNILLNGEKVNSNIPNVAILREGLKPFQQDALQEALNKGLAKTNRKAGSLESVNKVKQELNDMIVKSQNVNPQNRLSSVDGSGTPALREVKKRVDKFLGQALKGRDRGYHKAKKLESAYNSGLRYNPNNMNNIDLVPDLKPMGRNAFAQGMFRRITNNPLTGKDLAKDALIYENTLADVLPASKYVPLIDNLNKQSTKFGRLSGMSIKAENKLRIPEASRIFARENLETKGATVGSGIDWLNSTLRGGAIKQASQNLMDPNFVGTKDSWVLEKYPYLANYLSAIIPQMRNE